MVFSKEGNLFGLLGCDVEDDPEFVCPSKKKTKEALKAEKKEVKAKKEKTEEKRREVVKAPIDTRAKRIEYQPRLDARPYVLRTKNNDKNNAEAEAKAERLKLQKEAMTGGADCSVTKAAGGQKTVVEQRLEVDGYNHGRRSYAEPNSYQHEESNNGGADYSVQIAGQQSPIDPQPNINRQGNDVGPNGYKRNYNGYNQRNNNGYNDGFRGGNAYQRRSRGYDGGYRRGAGDMRYERKNGSNNVCIHEENSGERVVEQGNVMKDNDDNGSWSVVGRRGRVSKKGSISEDLNGKSESIEGSDYSSRVLEQQSVVGDGTEEDEQSVKTPAEGDAHMTVGEKEKDRRSGKSAEGQEESNPKEEDKITFTLKEFEAQQLEKRKALEAFRRSEPRLVRDKEFESMKLIGKKEEFEPKELVGKKEEERTKMESSVKGAEQAKNKAHKPKRVCVPVTKFVVPAKDEILRELEDGTWVLVKRMNYKGQAYTNGGDNERGSIYRRRRYARDDKDKSNGGDDKERNYNSSTGSQERDGRPRQRGNADEQRKDLNRPRSRQSGQGVSPAAPEPPRFDEGHFPGLW